MKTCLNAHAPEVLPGFAGSGRGKADEQKEKKW
jgi:hypothetical protein